MAYHISFHSEDATTCQFYARDGNLVQHVKMMNQIILTSKLSLIFAMEGDI